MASTNNAVNNSSAPFTVSSGNLTVTLGNVVASAGSVSASTTATAGTNLVATAGNLLLPTTSATVGQIQLNSVPWFHGYGTGNLFIGQNAGNFTFNTTNSTSNVGIGYYALNAITGAGGAGADSRNVAVGYGAMRYDFGSAAGNYASNVAVGYQAMGANVGSSATTNTVAIGDSAGYQSGVGGFNVFVGAQAGYHIDGSYNVAVGYQALYGASNYVLSNNVVVGDSAATQLPGGSNDNVIIGYQAASGQTHTLTNSVLIGYQAGYRINSVSTGNVLIGSQAGGNYTTNGESNNICFGNNVQGTTGESNVTRIGVSMNKAYISGIYNITNGATAGVVIVDSSDQLGSLSGTAGQVLQGGTKPAFSTATYPLTTAQGDLLLSSADNTITTLTKSTTATNYLSNTGTSNNAAWAQVNLTNGVTGILPPANGGILPYTEITSSPQAITPNNGYIANMGTLLTFTLPATAAQGTRFEIIGKGAGFWNITQGAGQTIHQGATSTTTGVGGTVTSSQQWASALFVCITANTDWAFVSSTGTITLA